MNNSYVRKIDELGRVVIPKEVRNKLNIQDNENIIIYSDNKSINITKYSYLGENNNFIINVCDSLADIYKIEVDIFDRDKIIFSNNKSGYRFILEKDLIKDSVLIGSIKFYSNSLDNNIIKFFMKIINLYFNGCWICKV